MKDTTWKLAHAALVLWAVVCSFLFFLGIPAYWYVVWKATKKAYPRGFFRYIRDAAKNKTKTKAEWGRREDEVIREIEILVKDLTSSDKEEAADSPKKGGR